MILNKRTRKEPLAHCDEIHDDDCIDPRDFFKPPRDDRREGRKARQLCRQVAETLDMVLSGECRDELLQSLHVLSVDPAPNSARLLVTLAADIPADRFDRQAILDRLNDQSGRLRAEVAAAITRKRTPVLVFHVIGPGGGGDPATLATEPA
jgi:ribosome-binding factor A